MMERTSILVGEETSRVLKRLFANEIGLPKKGPNARQTGVRLAADLSRRPSLVARPIRVAALNCQFYLIAQFQLVKDIVEMSLDRGFGD